MLSAKNATLQRPQAASRRTVTCRAQSQQVQKLGQVAATLLATAMIAMPAMAASDVLQEKVKPILCASNPTASICLKNSYKKVQTPKP